jgi:hypothetical protein
MKNKLCLWLLKLLGYKVIKIQRRFERTELEIMDLPTKVNLLKYGREITKRNIFECADTYIKYVTWDERYSKIVEGTLFVLEEK